MSAFIFSPFAASIFNGAIFYLLPDSKDKWKRLLKCFDFDAFMRFESIVDAISAILRLKFIFVLLSFAILKTNNIKLAESSDIKKIKDL